MFFASVVSAEQQPAVEVTPDMLWEQAVAARDADRSMAAAVLFQRLQNRFPGAAQAEEALWQAGQQAKKHALVAKDPNWRYVRDLFKRYTVDYPDSPRYQDAYYEGAVAYYNMRLFREALIYFNLFLRRFPKSPLAPQARYWQGQTFLAVDRLAEATKVFDELSNSDNPALRLRGYVGLGDALFAGKQYLAALAAYKKVIAKSPNYYFEDPTLLVKFGKTYFKVGNEEQGRRQLFHYLNLDKTSRRRAEVLFEAGESYHRQGDEDAAQRLYEMTLKEGVENSHFAILSRFRKAQHEDDPNRVVPDWQEPVDLKNPVGDKPYVDVLDFHQRDSIAQDARLALIRRYQAREDNDKLFQVAADFVRYAPDGPLRQEMQSLAGNLLVLKVEGLLEAKEYQDVYDLYRAEYSHVTSYTKGRLLYLIGQAFEGLTLYDQAAVIYYRALALPLSDEDKVDLYSRRAKVYLAKKDFTSAERLLTHLRKIYEGDKAIVKFLCLSGHLSDGQNKGSDALDFYSEAVIAASSFGEKPMCTSEVLGSLTRQERNEEARVWLGRFEKDGWLAPEEIQNWHSALGDNLLRAGDKAEALEMYLSGLAEGMPLEGGMAQSLQIRVGTLLALKGKVDEAKAYFEKARGGSVELWRSVAEERLNQLAIDSSLLTVEMVLAQ